MALSPEQGEFIPPIDLVSCVQDGILMADIDRLGADQPAGKEDIERYFADATRFGLPRETMEDILIYLRKTPPPQIVPKSFNKPL